MRGHTLQPAQLPLRYCSRLRRDQVSETIRSIIPSVPILILLENGTILTGEQLVAAQNGSEEDRIRAMLLSDDPGIWRRFG